MLLFQFVEKLRKINLDKLYTNQCKKLKVGIIKLARREKGGAEKNQKEKYRQFCVFCGKRFAYMKALVDHLTSVNHHAEEVYAKKKGGPRKKGFL